MRTSRSRLDDVQVASPCSVPWETMHGSERVRFCQQCRRIVFNLSAMSREEAEDLVSQRETHRVCIRFYRRADGTMLTADCPLGARAIRRAVVRGWGILVGSLAAALALFLGGISFSTSERKKEGGVRQIEPFASLCAWLNPPVPEPDPESQPTKVPDPSKEGYRMGW